MPLEKFNDEKGKSQQKLGSTYQNYDYGPGKTRRKHQKKITLSRGMNPPKHWLNREVVLI